MSDDKKKRRVRLRKGWRKVICDLSQIYVQAVFSIRDDLIVVFKRRGGELDFLGEDGIVRDVLDNGVLLGLRISYLFFFFKYFDILDDNVMREKVDRVFYECVENMMIEEFGKKEDILGFKEEMKDVPFEE